MKLGLGEIHFALKEKGGHRQSEDLNPDNRMGKKNGLAYTRNPCYLLEAFPQPCTGILIFTLWARRLREVQELP